jgi:hypothetical protein
MAAPVPRSRARETEQGPHNNPLRMYRSPPPASDRPQPTHNPGSRMPTSPEVQCWAAPYPDRCDAINPTSNLRHSQAPVSIEAVLARRSRDINQATRISRSLSASKVPNSKVFAVSAGCPKSDVMTPDRRRSSRSTTVCCGLDRAAGSRCHRRKSLGRLGDLLEAPRLPVGDVATGRRGGDAAGAHSPRGLGQALHL